MHICVDTRKFDFPDIALPDVWTVRYTREEPPLEDVAQAARQAAHALVAGSEMRRGSTVAVGVGSRGIANLSIIVSEVIGVVRAAGLEPFIVPAMGSHGGATAEGQKAILEGYGITEGAMGAPIRATMDVLQLGALDDGYPIYFDRHAAGADHVIVVNRIKHHTDFRGPIESGLCKMCAIGLGKRQGADAIHRFGADGLRQVMPEIGRRLVVAGRVAGGIAIIENERGRTAAIEAVPANGIGREMEEALLLRARAIAPRLAFDNADVLVVDEMGKDISGTGMDTHVIGRVRMPSVPETDWDGPNVRMVVALGLTERTHGNAAGLCLADIVTRRLMEQSDLGITGTNHRTSQEGGAWRGGIPIILEDADGAVRAALGMCGRGNRAAIRLARILNTEVVDTLEVSAPLAEEAAERGDLEVVRGPHRLDLSAPAGGDR
jgi:hypothetical protein